MLSPSETKFLAQICPFYALWLNFLRSGIKGRRKTLPAPPVRSSKEIFSLQTRRFHTSTIIYDACHSNVPSKSNKRSHNFSFVPAASLNLIWLQVRPTLHTYTWGFVHFASSVIFFPSSAIPLISFVKNPGSCFIFELDSLLVTLLSLYKSILGIFFIDIPLYALACVPWLHCRALSYFSHLLLEKMLFWFNWRHNMAASFGIQARGAKSTLAFLLVFSIAIQVIQAADVVIPIINPYGMTMLTSGGTAAVLPAPPTPGFVVSPTRHGWVWVSRQQVSRIFPSVVSQVTFRVGTS